MSFLKNTVSLLAIFSVLPAAYAATARPSVLNTATAISASGAVRRMPTMTAYISGSAGTTGSTSSTTSSTLLANAECIDAYTQCVKGADACGPNFEECTTNVLFHAQMPECISTLAQCSSAGVQSLFGTSNISALSNVATKNDYGEITEYTYPTTGSVLGQMISAAAISNRYDTSACVRRYTSCLRKDSVCGADFELCTTNSEFKKQAVFCDSTLARCASDGKLELFGNAGATSSTAPTATSRIGEMITEGAALAAVNAVSTCYKVADQCILNACGENPYKCYENSTQETINLVDVIATGKPLTSLADKMVNISSLNGKSNIASYVKNACLDTIGSNKYCYATFISDGVMPTSSQLRDEDNQEEVFDLAYSARMNSGMKAKIADLVNKFDTRAKEKCIETISQCAMRSCGGGSGAACYSLVFSDKGKNSINADATRDEIKNACQSVVNSDANCQYAAQNPNSVGTYNYTFTQADAFDTLFPEYDDGAGADPIGVVASLNASLSTSYNTAAIAQMKKRCQSVATSCVKSMCGNDYASCYRNRTDIQSDLTDTGNAAFDKSMNKAGGVLDYSIVLGLCIDTVKNANVCEEHLKIEEAKYNLDSADENTWGGASDVRSGWLDAGSTKKSVGQGEIYATDDNGNRLCTNDNNVQGVCDTVDGTGGVYDEPVIIGYDTYVQTQAARSLFKDLIYDLEIEAQGIYKAKLTKQQNMCLSANNGGIMGNKDLGSTYLWAKLKSNKVPTNYSVAGLSPNQFVASNDLYGSFCRIRVTLHSDDKYIQDTINNGADWSTAYFVAGDAFTCGSWIPNSELEKMANAAGDDARADKKATQPKIQGWMAALGALGGGVGGGYLGAGIQDGSVLGGLTGIKKQDDSVAKKCRKYYNGFETAISDINTASSASTYINKLIDLTEENAGEDGVQHEEQIRAVRTALRNYNSALSAYTTTTYKDSYTSNIIQCNDEKKAQLGNDAVYAFLNGKGIGYPQKYAVSWLLDACANGKPDTKCGSGNLSYPITSCFDKDDEDKYCGTDRALYDAYYKAYNSCQSTTENVLVKTGDALKQDAFNSLGTPRNELIDKVDALLETCESYAKGTDDKKKGLSKGAAAAIGAGVTAAAGGILTWQITKSIQDAELDKAQQAAISEFMNNVGSKIRCYVGSEEVGMYGDIITTSME